LDAWLSFTLRHHQRLLWPILELTSYHGLENIIHLIPRYAWSSHEPGTCRWSLRPKIPLPSSRRGSTVRNKCAKSLASDRAGIRPNLYAVTYNAWSWYATWLLGSGAHLHFLPFVLASHKPEPMWLREPIKPLRTMIGNTRHVMVMNPGKLGIANAEMMTNDGDYEY
jgi:hypothetical protein